VVVFVIVVMPATVRTRARRENARRKHVSIPLTRYARSPVGAIPSARSRRYARLDVAPHHPPDSGRSPVRNDLVIDCAIAVGVFAASVGMLAAGGTDLQDAGGEVGAVGIVLSALASLPLVARRRAPLAVFVVTAIASAALQGLEEPAGPPLGPTLALYWLAAAGEESRARSRLTLALVGALTAVHLTAAGLGRDAFPDVEMLLAVLVWGGAWLAGDRTRLRRERMAELEERAARAERDAERERRLAAAEERARIARDLHDSAGHAINVILVHAGLGRLLTDRDPERAREAFETIEAVARETVGEIDDLVSMLREDAPHDRSDDVEPPPGLAALETLIAQHRAAGMKVTTRVSGNRRPLAPAVDRGAYRILQEALTNAARHGDGHAQVEVAFGESALDLRVANTLRNGRGDTTEGGGHGIIGMRERAALLGGSVEAGARAGQFRMQAHLPLARA
jgi:signal transduction histidine kinase